MHVSAYLLGLCYYIAAPLSLFLTGRSALPPGLSSPAAADVTSIACLVAGAAVFAWGNLHQHRCHAILASLRQGGKKGYFIPQGDWFAHVSCPHYLAEIMIYFGLLVSLGSRTLDSTLLLMFAWVVSNLTLSALETHQRYLAKFPDYPNNRRAILPYTL
ncbi:unnamed protein product [Closterium sp. Yama58-4]|nr:unnamed protein product [Closterium sp. Yama58-4]